MSASKSAWALIAAIGIVLAGVFGINAADPSTSNASPTSTTTASVAVVPATHAPPSRTPSAPRAAHHTTSRSVQRPHPSRPAAAAQPQQQQQPKAATGSVVIHVITVSSAAHAQSQMDRCAGAVEIDYSPWGLPNDIAQHNYCGGAWFASLATGTHVAVVGGAHAGAYIVGQKRYVSHGQDVGVLRGIGDLALQTCVGGNEMVYVGLNRA